MSPIVFNKKNNECIERKERERGFEKEVYFLFCLDAGTSAFETNQRLA
jgi:hypothetical protein